jgi:hypothetical protein
LQTLQKGGTLRNYTNAKREKQTSLGYRRYRTWKETQRRKDKTSDKADLEGVGSYYCEKVASWILEDSCIYYFLEEKILKHEDKISHYFHLINEQKLWEIVRNELPFCYQTRLLENKHLGCLTLIRKYRKYDFFRCAGYFV